MIKILDCTLRDGGYINNWEFGFDNIKQIINSLSKSNLDYIECGFLKNIDYKNEKSIFSKTSQLKTFSNAHNLCLMINYGDIKIKDLESPENITLRIAFKKHERFEALEFCKTVKDKGFKIFINPMVTDSYTNEELSDLISRVNKISPIALTIADTIGEMTTDEITKLFKKIDNELAEKIAICFHSHNNLQMSFRNAETLIKLCHKHENSNNNFQGERQQRELIIDSSVFGMGRGAGNLCTELITQYLNKNYQKKYDITSITEVSHKYIMPIYEKTPWGCSVENYLAGINHCHPNYVKFLSEKGVKTEEMNRIFQAIPEEKKNVFDKEFIEKLVV